jgi:hypothetical protein
MSHDDCPRETEVTRAVLSGVWPDRAEPELCEHAAACAVCGEVASVALLLRQDHEHARRDVQVPAAGQVWWRAAVRARLEAAQAATQPMTWLHGITGACMAGVMLAALTLAWPSIVGAASWIKGQLLFAAAGGNASGVVSMALGQSLVLGVIAAVALLLTPVVLYFALSDDRGE